MRLLRVFVRKTKNGRQVTGKFLGDSGKSFYKSIGVNLTRADLATYMATVAPAERKPKE